MTTYMDIGRLLPSNYEIADRYHPLNNKFSKEFTGGMTKNASLNTASTNSKVHKELDGNFGTYYWSIITQKLAHFLSVIGVKNDENPWTNICNFLS